MRLRLNATRNPQHERKGHCQTAPRMSVRSPHPHPASARAFTPASETFLRSARHLPPHKQDSNHDFPHPPTKGAPAQPKHTLKKHRAHPALSRTYTTPDHTPKSHYQHRRDRTAKKTHLLGEPPPDNHLPRYSPKDQPQNQQNDQRRTGTRREVKTTTEKHLELI